MTFFVAFANIFPQDRGITPRHEIGLLASLSGSGISESDLKLDPHRCVLDLVATLVMRGFATWPQECVGVKDEERAFLRIG